VTEVRLALGASGHLTEEAARQHFATFAKGTPAERATLTFTWLPATYRCFGCLRVFQSTEPAASVECPTCGAVALEIAHEDTCAVSYIDVAYDGDGAEDGASKGATTGAQLATPSGSQAPRPS
jgi:Zn finger protein HypA/HybF involved in hydrogenase expression